MCQEDRTWSGTFPTCSLITCAVADVPVPMNAIIQEACKVEHVNYGTVCTISCQEGYEATGPSMSTDMTCSDDGDDVGSWSGDSIQCSEVTCLAPIPEESGFTPFTVECFYNDEQTTISDRQRISTSCSFECVDGYSLVEGSSARICLPTGEWSGNAVSCKDITPPELTCPVDAVLIAGKGTTSADIPWSLWEPILAIDLGTTIEATLLSINHIDVEENRTSSFSEGIHTLVYQARDSSENEADCSFSVTVTVCRCAPLQIPEDSIVTLQSGVGSCSTGVVYGSVCTISCEIGYELSTGDVSLSRTCDITESDQSCDATWSGVDPVCEIVRCNTPSITNGFLDCSPSTQHSVAYLTSCEFSCNTGYRTPTGEENRMRTCQANTTWSGEDFQCTEIVTCPARLGIPYGSVAPSPCESSDSVPFHSTCTFTCEAGFRLDGPISVECSPNGQWAPSGDSVCVDIQPPTFNLECPHKIEVDAPPNQVTAVVHFEEPIPQDNSGIVNLTRLDPSLTSGSTFPEGTTTIRYEATDGFALTSFCSIIIEVTVHRCSTLHPTLHGSMIGCDDPYIGSECSFSCDGGYDLEGASSLQCELSSDGIPAWNKDMPTCQIQTCRPLQVPEFASAPGCDDSFVTFGTTCTFSCEPGYTGKGASTLTCLEGGVWPSTDFECERISCEVLSEPTSISISPEICLSDPRFGDICTLECEQSGFKITPPNLKELTCNGDQTWSGNTEEAQCVDLQAPEFEDCPQDMVVFVNRGEDSAYVEWSVLVRDNDPQSLELVGMCNQQPGIMTIGEYVISCSAVDEAGNEGLCQFTLEVKARECETLSPPEHGYLLDECKMIHGCACHLECSEGYILEGSSTATCEFDGSDTYWHYEDTPVCRTTSCTPLVVPDEVILSPSTCSGSDMVPDGTVCTMSCDFLLTLDTDLRSFTCREGEWDQELDISVIPCKDEVPPTIRDCPQSPLRVDRIKLWGVEVTFFNPTAIDNFDTELLITTDPLDLKSPYNFTSDTKCTYTFTDEAGNSVSCVFKVDITNKVQPVITSCPLGGEVIATEGTVEVKYEHPSYSPIPGIDLVVSCDVPDSPVTLPVGHHEITCYVSDPETALQSECKMDFDVTYVSRCPHLYPPENGALACDRFAYGQFCSMLCEKGYDIPRKAPRTEMFICSTSGDWSPRSDVPGCSERKPRSVSRNVLPETLYYPSPCSENEDTSVNTIAQGFLDILKASEFGYICEDNDQCSVENVNVSCGIRSDRRRRHISDNGPFARISPLDNMMAEKKGGDTPVDTMHKKDNPKTTILSSDAGCDEGHSFDKVDLKCVPCPAGYYFDKATKICNPCDLGFYQDRQAQNECKLCREDTSTIEKGATDAKQCKEFCPAGYFSKSGFFPCRRCPPGFYQRRPQSTSCRRCPVNTTTTISGATSVKSCHILN
ncbi:sushi, von Willebrand factor type A, EGF and pentraxin domain-containing protein 1-like [Lytechinus variegatus]|uniref:sushi, von Willebrand factor type A, EGF and pentraxin domain-containing protein 1-like n=1 Tax=Lytechinus variegatus TaxID=7654 RepID=UPI001BB2492B|nr:sushi, von Willebrand factor type A, EGF and pentraxin domain-containing protein 1-like [Lytechinus variegatus]